MSDIEVKFDIEKYLNEFKYDFTNYVPSKEAIRFIEFIKLVNIDRNGEENVSPLVHYKMIDNIFSRNQSIAIMCHRGFAKSSIIEYLIWYMALFGKIPNFGKVNFALYISDSIENGVKTMRNSIDSRYDNSSFLREHIPDLKTTEQRIVFKNKSGYKFMLKLYGAKCQPLDAKLYTDNGFTTIGDCKVGDYIYTPFGTKTKIIYKSPIFDDKDMYRIELIDGRTLDVTHDHIIPLIKRNNNGTKSKIELTVDEILKTKIKHLNKKNNCYKYFYAIENIEPVKFSEKKLPIDPYLLGLLLGDGRLKKDGSCNLTGDKNDIDFYMKYIKEEIGTYYSDKRRPNVITITIKGISSRIRDLNLVKKSHEKFIPDVYKFGSIKQRLLILQGLMDTDGTIYENGRMSFSSTSEQLANDVANIVRSLGGEARIRFTISKNIFHKNKYKVEIKTNRFIPFKLKRKKSRFRKRIRTNNIVSIVSIKKIKTVKTQCIAVEDTREQYITDNFLRTHNTGVRGAREQGTRPQVSFFDDLIQSSEDARSKPILERIENTIYSNVEDAMDPQHRKFIWAGTPFNQNDPLYKAIQSGAWSASVYPVCEKFPCKKDEFVGSWEDRFDWNSTMQTYLKRKRVGRSELFFREMMLRITAEEDRLVKDEDIVWFNRDDVIKTKDYYNFYITTDFATSEKDSADFSAIFVWAVNSNGDYMLIDGIMTRQLMNKNIDDLFRFVQIYKPLGVGIEITGQQGGFISWIKQEMIRRHIYFALLGNSGSGTEGVRPTKNKFERFMLVQPLFKMRKIWLPTELKDSELIRETMNELKNTTVDGIKSAHDEAIDCISMLGSIDIIKPSEPVEFKYNIQDMIWEIDDDEESEINPLII